MVRRFDGRNPLNVTLPLTRVPRNCPFGSNSSYSARISTADLFGHRPTTKTSESGRARLGLVGGQRRAPDRKRGVAAIGLRQKLPIDPSPLADYAGWLSAGDLPLRPVALAQHPLLSATHNPRPHRPFGGIADIFDRTSQQRNAQAAMPFVAIGLRLGDRAEMVLLPSTRRHSWVLWVDLRSGLRSIACCVRRQRSTAAGG